MRIVIGVQSLKKSVYMRYTRCIWYMRCIKCTNIQDIQDVWNIWNVWEKYEKVWNR